MLHNDKSKEMAEKTKNRHLLLEDIFKKKEDQDFLKELDYDLKQEVTQRHRDTKTSILHDAVDHKRTDIVERLLSQDIEIDINEKDPHTEDIFRFGNTPLLLAIIHNDEATVNVLLKRGAKADICDRNGASPLMVAAVRGNRTMLARLLEKEEVGINDENMLDKDRSTALMYAARGAATLNAQFLIDKRAERKNTRQIDVLDCGLTQRTREKLDQYFKEKEKASRSNKLENTSLHPETTVARTESKQAPLPEKSVLPSPQEKLSTGLHDVEQHVSKIRIADKEQQPKKQKLVIQSVDREILSKQLKDKRTVVHITDESIKKGHIKEVASLLEEMSHSGEISSYWDIDGGFEAMALLGNEFNMKHAHYFMTRIKKDPSWRAKPAADALLKLAEKVTDGPAIQAMIVAMTALFETKYSDCDGLMEKITTIISQATMDSHISSLLKSELESPVEIESHISTWAEFENAITAKSKTCFSLLEMACSRGITMTFNDASTTIQLANGINIHVGSTRDYQTIKNFVTSLKQDKTTLKRDVIIKGEKTASAIPEEKLHLMIYNALQDKNKVAHVAQFALGNKIISKEILANFFQRLIQEAPQSIKGYWDVDGGFDTMAMLGDQFNVIHADYFIDRINAGSQQSSPAALNAIKKLVSNITEEKASAIPALSKIATYLKNSKPMLFDEIKDTLEKRFKLASMNDGEIQLTLLKQAKTSEGGLFKHDLRSRTVPLPQAGQTVKTQKKVGYHDKAKTFVGVPKQIKTSKTGVFKQGKTFPLQVSQTADQDRPVVYRASTSRSTTTT